MSVAAPPTNEFANHLPPQNLEAERSVLGCMMLLNEAIDEVAEFLQANHFYSDAHQRLYAAILNLYETGAMGIDVLTVGEELARNNEIEEVGGALYLNEILETVPHAAHAKYYAEIVRDKYVQRSLISACTETLRECYDTTCENDEVLQGAEQRIFSILENQDGNQKMDIGGILIDAWDRINSRLENEGTISGLATGFVDLDEQTNGFQPAELIILAARPSMGKTALVCNLAENVASQTGTGVLIFSLEQSKLELAERFLCIRSKVNGHKVRSGDLNEEERHRLLEASQELSEVPLFLDDFPGRTIAQIGAVSRRLKRQHDLGLIIIDYLQLIEPEDKRIPREQQIAIITRRLKHISKELDVPLIALAQLNRGVELRDDKRPRLADLRESGAIEQDADLVMFLHRPDAYDPADSPGKAEVIVAKHRSGPTGIVTLTWRKEYMRFENSAADDLGDHGF